MNHPNYFTSILEEYNSLQQIAGFVNATHKLTESSINQQVGKEIQATSPEDLISIAFRIEQIAIRLFSYSESTEYQTQSKSAFEQAAKILEQISESQAIDDNEVILELYLHSAIDYSLGEFQANAAVIAKKVLENFAFDNNSHSSVLQSTFLLLKGDFLKLDSLSKEIIGNKC